MLENGNIYLEMTCCMGVHLHCLLNFQDILPCQAKTTNHTTIPEISAYRVLPA